MDTKEAGFTFLVWINLQCQLNEADTEEIRSQLVAQRQSVLKILHDAGFEIKATAPCVPKPEIVVTFNLKKIGEATVIARKQVRIRFTPEQLQKIQETYRPPTRPMLNLDEAVVHFKEYVDIFRKSVNEGITSAEEKGQLIEMQETALQELALLGWEINLQHIVDYNVHREDRLTSIFTFLLLPLERTNEHPAAVEEVTVTLSTKAWGHLETEIQSRVTDEGLLSAEESAKLLREIMGNQTA